MATVGVSASYGDSADENRDGKRCWVCGCGGNGESAGVMKTGKDVDVGW